MQKRHGWVAEGGLTRCANWAYLAQCYLPSFEEDSPMVEDKNLFRKALDAMLEVRSREAARQTDRSARVYGCDFGASRRGVAH